MIDPKRQCAAIGPTGERCGSQDWVAVKRTDTAKDEHDPTRVTWFKVCEPCSGGRFRIHPDAVPVARSAR